MDLYIFGKQLVKILNEQSSWNKIYIMKKALDMK